MVFVSALWCLSQHLLSYLGFSYLGRGVSLHCCSSKAQLLLLTLEDGYLVTIAPPDLERGVAPLGPPAPTQPPLLGCGVAPLGYCSWPRTWGSSSRPLLHRCSPALWDATPDLRREVAPLFGRNDAKAETPVLWPPHLKSWLIGKYPDAGRDWGQEEKGTTRGWDGWMASPTQWTWVWVNSGSWW